MRTSTLLLLALTSLASIAAPARAQGSPSTPAPLSDPFAIDYTSPPPASTGGATAWPSATGGTSPATIPPPATTAPPTTPPGSSTPPSSGPSTAPTVTPVAPTDARTGGILGGAFLSTMPLGRVSIHDPDYGSDHGTLDPTLGVGAMLAGGPARLLAGATARFTTFLGPGTKDRFIDLGPVVGPRHMLAHAQLFATVGFGFSAYIFHVGTYSDSYRDEAFGYHASTMIGVAIGGGTVRAMISLGMMYRRLPKIWDASSFIYYEPTRLSTLQMVLDVGLAFGG